MGGRTNAMSAHTMATTARYITTTPAQRGMPWRARSVTAGSRMNASAKPMKNAGSAPRAVHSSRMTITIITRANSAWRWRRTVASSSVIVRMLRAASGRWAASPVRSAEMTNRTTEAGPRQRWQLLFSRAHPALRMRQAVLVDELERAFKEASLPLSYTRAIKPRPRIKLAANLPIGIELRGEVVEAYFDEPVPLERIESAAERFPDGIELRDATEVWHGFPSAASQLRGAASLRAARREGGRPPGRGRGGAAPPGTRHARGPGAPALRGHSPDRSVAFNVPRAEHSARFRVRRSPRAQDQS